jgi:serine/threonine-protein kinase
MAGSQCSNFGDLNLEKLGPYDLLNVIGRGGMGSVYRARHRESGEIHAVKSLLDNFSDQQHFRNRFESEIRALIKLDHPNIVRIISFGQEMGTLYFAMELVDGASLFQLQKKGHPFDWRDILAIARQVAKGLRHAHDRGIVHRDLKPGNLLMPIDQSGQHGQVKLTDFGIAKRFGTSQNTGDNLIGTMDFMSPEQAKGQPATARSDLYSLGTVLYTLLAGKPPFSSNSFEESLRKLTRVPAPAISSVVPNVPKPVDALIQKLMAKQPDKRIQTAQALLFKLDEVEQELLESSQAKTCQVPISKQDDTFEVMPQGDIATHPNTRRAEPADLKGGSLVSDRPVSVKVSASTPTLVSQDEEAETNRAKPTRMIDFYNTVSDHVRAQQFREPEPTEATRGLWWILAALMGVVCLVVWGLIQAARPKPADQLFARLEAVSTNPSQTVEIASQFLTHYADDSRADEVRRRLARAEADRQFNGLLNKLHAREKLTNSERLSDIESQLLNIFNSHSHNKELAATKMAAFAAVYEGVEDLSESDQLCIEAAKYFHRKFKEEARTQLLTKLQFIRRTIETIEAEENQGSVADRYRSLVELYGDENWDDSPEGLEARRLMDQVKRKFRQ